MELKFLSISQYSICSLFVKLVLTCYLTSCTSPGGCALPVSIKPSDPPGVWQ